MDTSRGAQTSFGERPEIGCTCCCAVSMKIKSCRVFVEAEEEVQFQREDLLGIGNIDFVGRYEIIWDVLRDIIHNRSTHLTLTINTTVFNRGHEDL